MAIEFELKFRADDAALAAIAAAYPQQHHHFDMQTTYYDTPSAALSARHYTLRRRMENDESVCTLKCPAEGLGRQEIELCCQDIHAAISYFSEHGAPEDFSTLVQEGLLPVCSASFHRIAILVTQPDCVLEIALDKGSLSGGDKTIALCEVEVELKEGAPQAAVSFARVLAQLYNLTPEKHSKFRRAHALYKGETL